MATQIIWKINQLNYRASDGFVVAAHWVCSGTEGAFVDSVYACTSFDGKLITPYDKLTESQVLGWVWGVIDKEATEQAVISKIEEQKNPVVRSGLPWPFQ